MKKKVIVMYKLKNKMIMTPQEQKQEKFVKKTN